MITDFKLFGVYHISSIGIASIIALVFVYWGLRSEISSKRKNIRLLLAGVIILIRGSRYIMDIYYGRFDWFDLFSLHICHIDLVLLIICLVKPKETIFSFNFLIGIPVGLIVAFMPGTNHPEPGLSRAILFIMSHMMLAWGALYLAIVEKMKVKLKTCLDIAKFSSVGFVAAYFINKSINTNFLYIMEAPQGTVIKQLENFFGWPGYVFVMYFIGIGFVFFFYFLSRVIDRLSLQKNHKTN